MLVRAARDLAVSCARATGAIAALRWLRRDGVTILCYHSVVESTLPRLVAYGGLHLSLRTFQQHIDYVSRHYTVVSLQSIAQAARTGGDVPRRAVVLTFDDGYANNVKRVAEILASHGMRATLFLATDYVGQSELFWWDELSAMVSEAPPRRYVVPDPWGPLDLTSESNAIGVLLHGRELLESARRVDRRALLDTLNEGLLRGRSEVRYHEELRPARWDELAQAAQVFEYGGHTAQHRVLDRVEPADAHQEIGRCRDTLANRLSAYAVPAFSYPAGRYSDTVVGLVRGLGFTTAVTTESTPRLVRDRLAVADPSRLPRAGVSAGTSTSLLAAMLAGVPRWSRRDFE